MNASPDATQLRDDARIALACLDLTSLNDADDAASVQRLCQRAQSRFGAVAAVCVWPRLAAVARAQLPAHIGVAAVANFPHGGSDVAAAVADVRQIVQAGAQEVDLVLPYAALMRGDETTVQALLHAARQACPDLRLKVILETGALFDPAQIARACRLSIEAGADFLKTSTGKTPISATPQAAHIMLAAIAGHTERPIGFKASGGIRSMADAATYIDLTRQHLGEVALNPARLRLGASNLLDAIEAVLAGAGDAPESTPASNY